MTIVFVRVFLCASVLCAPRGHAIGAKQSDMKSTREKQTDISEKYSEMNRNNQQQN
jgi:hypothetical protein